MHRVHGENARPDVRSTSYVAWWWDLYASLPKLFDDIDCAGDGMAPTKLVIWIVRSPDDESVDDGECERAGVDGPLLPLPLDDEGVAIL